MVTENITIEKIDSENEVIKDQFLAFIISNEVYGVSLPRAKEIIKPTKITNVPNTPPHVLGVINLRGQIVPVISLRIRLGLEEKENQDKTKRLLIVEMDKGFIGLMVDMVKEVIQVTESAIEEVKNADREIKEEYIKGVVRLDNHLVIIIHLDNLLETDGK